MRFIAWWRYYDNDHDYYDNIDDYFNNFNFHNCSTNHIHHNSFSYLDYFGSTVDNNNPCNSSNCSLEYYDNNNCAEFNVFHNKFIVHYFIYVVIHHAFLDKFHTGTDNHD